MYCEIPLFYSSCPPDSISEGDFSDDKRDRWARIRYLTGLSTVIKYTHPPFDIYLGGIIGPVKSILEAEAVVEEAQIVYPQARGDILLGGVGHGRLSFAKTLILPDITPAQLDGVIDRLAASELGYGFSQPESPEELRQRWLECVEYDTMKR